MDFTAVQSFMRERGIDGWLVHDFRGNNPVFSRAFPGKTFTTRRIELFVPLRGDPTLLVHHIDADYFKDCSVKCERYLTWQQYRAWIASCAAGAGRIAMEYSPGCMLPVMAIVDAGTVELVRASGAEVVSSADLVQVYVARWSAEAVKNHEVASKQVDQIKDGAFDLIRDRIRANQTMHEYEVQQWIMSRFAEQGLETPDPPIVAVNEHAGDPHFEVSAKAPAAIKRGDWVLIDLWARRPGNDNIFSDVTWVGYAGTELPAKHRAVQQAVFAARDAALACVQKAWAEKRTVQGWQVDQASQDVLVGAGFERFIRHRTGHSLSPGPKVHGIGVNIDNTETHDTREVMPGIGFTIEPGLYLAPADGGFGVRSEINVYIDPVKGPVVTSGHQREVKVLV